MSKRTEQEIINELTELIEELGWVIGMPEGEGMVPGLVIGTREYVEDVVEAYYGPGYAVFEKDVNGNVTETAPSKKTTVH